MKCSRNPACLLNWSSPFPFTSDFLVFANRCLSFTSVSRPIGLQVFYMAKASFQFVADSRLHLHIISVSENLRCRHRHHCLHMYCFTEHDKHTVHISGNATDYTPHQLVSTFLSVRCLSNWRDGPLRSKPRRRCDCLGRVWVDPRY